MTEPQVDRDHRQPRMLHETTSWLVLNKPAGWHSVSGKSAEPDIESWLRDHFTWAKTLSESGLVHRLDFDTSGCLLAAKSEAEQLRLRELFQSGGGGGGGGGIDKVYLALARSGLPPTGEFRLFFTSRHRRSKKITVREQGESKHEGRCTWKILRAGAAPGHDLLEVRILGPGRRHQIRAGLAHLGHPLLGDDLYRGEPSDSGLALHAWKLVIEGVEVESPRPRFGM